MSVQELTLQFEQFTKHTLNIHKTSIWWSFKHKRAYSITYGTDGIQFVSVMQMIKPFCWDKQQREGHLGAVINRKDFKFSCNGFSHVHKFLLGILLHSFLSAHPLSQGEWQVLGIFSIFITQHMIKSELFFQVHWFSKWKSTLFIIINMIRLISLTQLRKHEYILNCVNYSQDYK